MPTCNDIITIALKQARILASGGTPDAEEAADGLTALQGMYDGWVNAGLFGRLTDVYTAVAYSAHEQERIRAASSAVITIPTTFAENGLTGTDRAPRDLSLIEVFNVVAGTRQVSLFDRTAWVRLDSLELTDEAPLALRGASGLAACLADSYVEMFGGSLGPRTMAIAMSFRAALSYKLGSTRDSLATEYF